MINKIVSKGYNIALFIYLAIRHNGNIMIFLRYLYSCITQYVLLTVSISSK